MVKKAVIWDLDGTLLDSYDVIVESLRLTMLESGVHLRYEDIRQHAIAYSVSSFIRKVSEEYGISADHLKQRYAQISGSRYLQIKKMKNAKEILTKLQNDGVENFVFTHRGRTTIPVLDHLGFTDFFREILTSQSGFPRKPAPDAICYLIDKYGLDHSQTYYVGDRSLDMECAKNACICGILYLPEGSIDVSGNGETYTVQDLMQICNIL